MEADLVSGLFLVEVPDEHADQLFQLRPFVGDMETGTTGTVRNWYSGAWANDGFELGLDDMLTWPYMISLDVFQFYSSEDPGGRGPKLVVNYQ